MTGLLLAAAEIGFRWVSNPAAGRGAVPQTFVVLIAAGTALGTVSAAIEHTRQLCRFRAESFYAALLAPALVALGLNLSSGGWISQQWFAPYGVSTLAILGSAALWSAIRMANIVASDWMVPQVLAVAAVLLALLDLHSLPGLYPSLHNALLVAAWAAGAEAITRSLISARALLERRSVEGRLRAKRWAIGAAVVLATSVPLSIWKSPNVDHRVFWTAFPGFAVQVYAPAHLAYWTFQSRRAPIGDGYDNLISAWIKQQPDSASLSRDKAKAAWAAANAPSARSREIRPIAGARRPNILLITVDALRADVAATGPNFSKLAAKGLAFKRAYAPAASTYRSIPRLLSGKFEWRHQPNIIRELNNVGYDTAFATNAFARHFLRNREQNWLDDPKTILTVDAVKERSTKALNARALAFLRNRRSNQPLFLWVHYYDLHEWEEITAFEGRDRGTVRQRYESIWRTEDQALGEFASTAEALLAPQPTAFIVTSDHGEYLGELGRVKHTRWVGLPVGHIPLFVIAPGLAPAVSDRPVGIFDIAPTVAELAQLPRYAADAVSLLHEDVDPLRPLVQDEEYEIAIVRGPRRLVLAPASGSVSVFDDTDISAPRELKDAELLDARKQLLLPLLGSPVAAAAASPL